MEPGQLHVEHRVQRNRLTTTAAATAMKVISGAWILRGNIRACRYTANQVRQKPAWMKVHTCGCLGAKIQFGLTRSWMSVHFFRDRYTFRMA